MDKLMSCTYIYLSDTNVENVARALNLF